MVNGNCSLTADFLILNDIKILMDGANGGLCNHIFHNVNEVANTLTKFTFSLVEDHYLLEKYSSCIDAFISADMASLS